MKRDLSPEAFVAALTELIDATEVCLENDRQRPELADTKLHRIFERLVCEARKLRAEEEREIQRWRLP